MSYTTPFLDPLTLSPDDGASESSASSAPDIDPDDPMRDYLLEKWREERAKKRGKKTKSKKRRKDETPEERRARKERKREKRAKREAGKSEGLKGVEALLRSIHSSALPK
jgi:RNA-binding motif X-linked protein 2